MSKIILSLALSAAAACILAAAPGPGMAEDTRLSTIFTAPGPAAPALRAARPRAFYSYRQTAPSLLAPGSGPPARARYSYRAVTPDPDGAPCPTRSRDSLGDLFGCTLR